MPDFDYTDLAPRFRRTTRRPPPNPDCAHLREAAIRVLAGSADLRSALAERLVSAKDTPKYLSVDAIPRAELRRRLVGYYSTQLQIEMVLDDAGVPVAGIGLDGPAEGIWFSALKEVDNLGRRQRLIDMVAEAYPHAFAGLLPQPCTATPEAVVDALAQLSAVDATRHLVRAVRDQELLRTAAQELGAVVQPMLVDWKTVQVGAGATDPHLTIQFIVEPLGESAAARADNRRGDFVAGQAPRARVSFPLADGVPPTLLKLDRAEKIAELIQRKSGRPQHAIAKDPTQLFLDANETILYNREELAEDDQHTLYCLFEEATQDELREIRRLLPSLWLIRGKSGGGVTLTNLLKELYQWPSP